MKVNLDARMIRSTGIGTYLQGLLHGIQQVQLSDITLILHGEWEHLSSYPYAKEKFEFPIYSATEHLGYWNRIKENSIWHIPHYNVPLFRKRSKLIVTVHDLIHWIFRKDFFNTAQACYAKTMFQKTCREADHIIAVSENTKKDLMKYFNLNPERVTVIYEAVHPKFMPAGARNPQNIKEKLGLPDSFFLYVGSLKPHKNIHRLLRIFKNLKLKNKLRSDLVIVGQKDKKYSKEFYELQTLQTSEAVHYVSGLDSAAIAGLYQSAAALVHPSLYEGFGLTPLEAMACGTPVLCSNAASLPEVVGDAALLFDPLDENAIGEALLRIESDPALRSLLIEKGRQRVAQFNWKKTADETIAVYRKVQSS